MRHAPGSEQWWAQARLELAQASDPRQLRACHRAIAREIHPLVRLAGVGVEEWWRLGVTVREEQLASATALSSDYSGQRLILVTEADRSLRRRFSVAHELGHLLLRDFRQVGNFHLTHQAEEQACDAFASEALMPAQLAEEFVSGRAAVPHTVLAVSKAFHATFAVTLRQLSGFLARHDSFAFVAAFPKDGPAVLRAHKAVGGQYFLAQNQTVAKLGLDELQRWASSEATSGSQKHGPALRVQLNLWQPGQSEGPRSGKAFGPAVWQALMLANGLVLVVLDVSGLRHRWYQPRRRLVA
jgi:hypothetical protein